MQQQENIESLGAITTINATDKISDSRTTINDNFTYLDGEVLKWNGGATGLIPVLIPQFCKV